MLWSREYETGNTIVDGQHKEIFRLVQQVLDADAFENRLEKIESAMNFLSNYAVNHFAGEEALMVESEYPDYDNHKAIHDDFVMQVVAFVEKFKQEGDSISISDAINDFVVAWLKEHIMGSDKAMADYYKLWEQSK